ncbi:MAG: hypothetical protein ACOCXH_13575 [Cyclobacteriaceae bacterium]
MTYRCPRFYLQDRQTYINALVETRKSNNINIIRLFMYDQQKKYFPEKIDEFKKKPGSGFHSIILTSFKPVP